MRPFPLLQTYRARDRHVQWGKMYRAVLTVLCVPAILASNVYVRVYSDNGADPLHVVTVVNQLQQSLFGLDIQVRNISANETINDIWESSTLLYVMPGGFDLGFLRSLGANGTEKIRRYVKNGGAYLGLGAGAYFACDKIEFDKGGPLEVLGDRPLKFFPGTCTGPFYQPYSYADFSSARAVRINFQFTHDESYANISVYYNGGNTFVESSQTNSGPIQPNCSTLASFTGVGYTSPAIVKCNDIGYNGVAVLAGVHPSFGSQQMRNNTYHNQIRRELNQTDTLRQLAFQSLLYHLNVIDQDQLVNFQSSLMPSIRTQQ